MASLENMTEEQVRSLAALANDISSNPETRREFQKIAKKVRSNLVFPELEVEQQIAAMTAKQTEEAEALRAELTKRDLADQRREIKKEMGEKFPGITFEEIEKCMVDNAIGKHESAAQFLANQRQLAEPVPEVPGRGGPMIMPTEARQFFKSPDRTARKLAYDAVTDLINKRNKARIGVS